MLRLNLKYFLPLLVMQAYLIITLVIFQFGPIEYNIKNPEFFWSLIFIYHIALIFGYFFACSFNVKIYALRDMPIVNSQLGLRWFYIVLILATFNLILAHGFFIIDFLSDPFLYQKITDSILRPGEIYADKMDPSAEARGNKIFNIFLFFIAFSQIFIIPLIIFNWVKISYGFKAFSILVSIIPMLISVMNGQNKGLFDFFILYAVAIVIVSIYERGKHVKVDEKNPKSLYVLPILALFAFLVFFGTAMSQRGGDLTYIETVDRANNIEVNKKSVILADDNFAYYTYAWLTSYVVQGYYGFSLSLEKDFDSTYGFGNSIFLARNIESIFNVDLQSRTFQRKIDSHWDEHAQWHSLYSYLANDFNFPGVAFVLFLLSFIFARAWISFLNSGNIFSGVLICIYGILIIFIPANNQIFGFLHGLSSYFWAFVFWVFSFRNIKL